VAAASEADAWVVTPVAILVAATTALCGISTVETTVAVIAATTVAEKADGMDEMVAETASELLLVAAAILAVRVTLIAATTSHPETWTVATTSAVTTAKAATSARAAIQCVT